MENSQLTDSIHFHEVSLTDNRQEYYRLAGQFANDHKFANKQDEKVWYLHTLGYGMPRICRTMNLKLWVVRWKINKYKKIMLEKINEDPS